MFRCDFKIQNKIIDYQFVDTNSKLNLVFAVFFFVLLLSFPSVYLDQHLAAD